MDNEEKNGKGFDMTDKTMSKRDILEQATGETTKIGPRGTNQKLSKTTID